MSSLVTPGWVAAQIGGSDIVILDATYYLPNENKSASALYENAHIPGAIFFDVDKISSTSSNLPHMLPTPDEFAAMVGALGISNRSKIIVYDQLGIFSSARVWWMFRVFGHEDITVLDGGLPAWLADGHATTDLIPSPSPNTFKSNHHPQKIRDLAAMRANLTTKGELVLDARAAGRFDGTVPEPRQGIKSGHIPGAKSLPFSTLLNDGKMKHPDKLVEIFKHLGVTPASRIVTSCGSGITAAVITLALAAASLPEGALYDGSWSEWGSHSDTPVEV